MIIDDVWKCSIMKVHRSQCGIFMNEILSDLFFDPINWIQNSEFVTGFRDWPTLDHCTIPQVCRAWYISPRDCSPVQTSGPPGFYFLPPTSQKPLGMSGYSSYGPCLSIIQEIYVQFGKYQKFISATYQFMRWSNYWFQTFCDDPIIGFKHIFIMRTQRTQNWGWVTPRDR